MKLILLILSLILFYSCSRIEDHGTIKNDKNILELDFKQQIKQQNSFLKNIIYIPLEVNENCLIGEIDRILYLNNRFYIFDQNISKSIFVFAKNGTFLHKLDKSGHGPGEYFVPNGFDVDSIGNIFVGDAFNKRILKYDSLGNYIDTYRTSYYIEEFCLFDDHKVLVRNAYKTNKVIASLGILDLLTDKLIRIIPGRDVFDDFDIPRFSSSYLFRSDNIIYYNPRFDNSIYKIANQEIMKSISYSQELCPSQEFVQGLKYDQDLLISNKKYILDLRNIFENSNFISISYTKSINSRNLIISKKSNRSYSFAKLKDRRYLGNNNFYGSTENEFISLIVPEMIKNKWIKKVKKSNLDEDVINNLLQFNSSSNPIICLVELEDI